MDYKNLVKTALDYRKRAYVPYSNFKVGAAVLFESGNAMLKMHLLVQQTVQKEQQYSLELPMVKVK